MRDELRDVQCPVCQRTTSLTRFEREAFCYGTPGAPHKSARMVEVAKA